MIQRLVALDLINHMGRVEADKPLTGEGEQAVGAERRGSPPLHVFFFLLDDTFTEPLSGRTGLNSSSKTSPNQFSNTLISSSITGTCSGQSSLMDNRSSLRLLLGRPGLTS